MDRTFHPPTSAPPAAPDAAYHVAEFRMQSAGERDEWAKVFPLELPETHEVRYSWHPAAQAAGPVTAPATTGAEGMVLRIEVVPRDSADNGTPRRRAAGQTTRQGTAAMRADLESCTKAELVTKGAEMGLELSESQQKPVLVAAVLKKQQENQAASEAGADATGRAKTEAEIENE